VAGKGFTKQKAAAGGAAGAAVAFGLLVALWQEQEGLRTEAYQDSIGVWTICYGHTGPEVQPGLRATMDDCRRHLDKDLLPAFFAVDRLVTADMTFGQWIAYTDFYGNAGAANFKKSSMLKYANKSQIQKSCDAFLLWVYAGGRDCRQYLSNCGGLVSRRAIERRYCLGELPLDKSS
jgi:lysozyme